MMRRRERRPRGGQTCKGHCEFTAAPWRAVLGAQCSRRTAIGAGDEDGALRGQLLIKGRTFLARGPDPDLVTCSWRKGWGFMKRL